MCACVCVRVCVCVCKKRGGRRRRGKNTSFLTMVYQCITLRKRPKIFKARFIKATPPCLSQSQISKVNRSLPQNEAARAPTWFFHDVLSAKEAVVPVLQLDVRLGRTLYRQTERACTSLARVDVEDVLAGKIDASRRWV